MSEAFRCNGCGKYHDGPPMLTIERTDGLTVFGERGTWHACSWECVVCIAVNHDVALEDV